jgi:putative ABC transport system permease protein
VTNSLLASLQDRAPAIGVMRAVGATRRQVLEALIIESGLVGLIAGACAVVAGSLVGYGGRGVFTELFDMSVLYRYPIGEAVGALAAAVILAAAVGFIPGRQASRVNVRSALTAE